MNELVKTGIYCGVAVLFCLSAILVRPSHKDVNIREEVGKELVPEFKDPDEAAGLKITTYDDELAQLKNFEVTRSKQYQNWVIPSHYDYPADAKEQMEIVASALADMKILAVASEVSKDHETYGVVEPAGQELKKGVGTRVEVTNTDGKVVVDMIVGKAVADADNQRFVRLTGQDLVYVVKLDPSKLSTKFEDWIEKDLLQLTAADVANVNYRDYAVVPTPGGRVRIESRLEMDVRWDATANKWQLEKMVDFVRNEPKPSSLLPGEELNDQVLNDMKSALDDLKIVDVRRKPKGLGADLRVSSRNLRKDATSLESLLTRGFYPISRQSTPDEVELLSANGEIHVSTKAGVQYVLRFGGIATAENAEDVNRYLFVATRLDESLIPKPELKPLPALPATKPAAEKKNAGKDAGKDAGAAKAETDAEKERDRIKKENERLQKEYDDKIKQANDKIKELNARFADWYYVISDGEFKKVHLKRDQMIKLSDKAKDEAMDLDAFRKLQGDGIEKKEEEPASPAGGPPNFGGGLPPGLGRP